MKKFIYLCGMMLLSMNMMAQIDTNDLNWRCVLNENFDEGSSYWQWGQQSFVNPSQTWRAYPGSGVTSENGHQVYQPSQSQIDVTNQCMELVAEYDSEERIPLNDYDLPSWMWPNGYPSSNGLYYFSGTINYIDRNSPHRTPETGIFRYGYFEIQCKLPVHKGAFPAFWLYAADPDSITDKFYEEIDIFEHTRHLMYASSGNTNPPSVEDTARVFTTGIYHNLSGHSPNHESESFARNFPVVPHSSEDLSGWHTFGCEWMPNHVYWFLDGRLVNSYTDQEHIPCHPLILKANYAIDSYAGHWNGDIWSPDWFDTDTMTINYINVYQLGWDCETEEIIACQSDLVNFDYAVKKSISITSTINGPVVSNTDKVTFRVADTFEIIGSFEVQQGGEFAVIQQDCPSDE